MPRLIGLVLVGGQGERLGQDKGLLRFGGMYFAESSAERLSHVVDRVCVSLRSDQAPSYTRILPRLRLVFDRPQPVGGPLRGLLSLLDESADLANGDAILALSTDLPLMTESTLLRLRDAFVHEKRRRDAGHRATSLRGAFYERDGQLEPMCGIYTVGLLREISGRIAAESAAGNPPIASLRHYLGGPGIIRLPIEAGQEEDFFNVNTPDDLRTLSASENGQ